MYSRTAQNSFFLSYEEYKVLLGTPKTAETFYTFVHLRNFPRQLRGLCSLQYHYFLAFGYVQDIVDMRVHTRGQTGFAAFERLLVEDYELFPPEYRKNRKSAPAGPKTHGKVCILEGTAGSVSGGMDLPTCSAEQETGEAIVSEERQHLVEHKRATSPLFRRNDNNQRPVEHKRAKKPLFRRNGNIQRLMEHKRAKRPMFRRNDNN